jgi:HSP20 family protein
MADVNVQKRQQEERGRGGEQRSQGGGGGGLARRGMGGLPALFSSPSDLLGMSPFTLMRRLTDDIDRMFSGMGGTQGQGQGQASDTGLWIPPVELREEGNNLVVNVELPGIEDENIRVEIRNDALVIQGERQREQDEERGGIRRSERFYGSFYRVIPLPEGVNADQATAQLNNGVLEIRIPMTEEAQRTRQVPIESGGQAQQQQKKPATTQAAGQTQQSKTG